MRVRGLKYDCFRPVVDRIDVAPHSGARIEMEKDELKLVNTLMSHPTQVRSLK